jgi:DNA-binding NarL/FixJ family response regulator
MTERNYLLIADDHPLAQASLRGILANQPDFELVGEATSAEAVEPTDRLRPKVALMVLG